MTDDGHPPVDPDHLLAWTILADARAELGFSSLAVQEGVTGLGLALARLAADAGVILFAGADGATEEARLAEVGGARVLRRDLADFADEVMRLSNGRGADAIVDQAAGLRFADNFAMIADFGDVLVTDWRDGDAPALFETMWAALDRCPSVQLWTLERYRAAPDRLRRLEEDLSLRLSSTESSR